MNCPSSSYKRNEMIMDYTNESIQHRVFQLAENSKDIIYQLQLLPRPAFIYISPSFEEILGKDAILKAKSESLNSFLRSFIHPDDIQAMYKRVKKANFSLPFIQRWQIERGDYIYMEEVTNPIYANGKLVGVEGVIRNVTKHIELHKQLLYQSSHDFMTDLYNRAFFDTMLVKYNSEINTSVAIILCDLDGLKYCNDQKGHDEGDQLIIEAANFLNKYTKENITVSRIGGDEFTIFMHDINEEDVVAFIEQIDKDLMAYNERTLRKLNISKGYAYTKSSKGKLFSLKMDADRAMYREKNQNKTFV